MNKKQTLLIIALVFVLLLGGAYALYGHLSQNMSTDQLAVQDSQAGNETQSPASDDNAEPQKILAPDFTVYDQDGNEVHLHDYIGKPIVLNFWASWCGPCQMEMPDFHEKYLELGEEAHFLMINITTGRETLDSAKSFIAEQGYTFPVLYDTSSDAAMTYGAYSLPMTFFIDADGYAIAQATGAISGDILQQGIDLILPAQ